MIIVLDVSDRHAPMQLATVRQTLDELGATSQVRVLVLNKVDRLADKRDLLVWLNREPDALPLSALTGEGVEQLTAIVLDHMLGGVREVRISLSSADTGAIDFLEKRAEVLDREYGDGQADFLVRIGRRHVDQLLARGAKMRINGLEPLEAVRQEWESGPAAVGRS